jgi:hypothetical protein
MLSVLRHRTYRRLFGAQAIALVGTGLATVALSLLAFELAGQSAGLVLGTALAIKMVAYVGIAPVATAVAQRLPRRKLLVALDLVRAAVALSLPFVTQIWQIYALILLLQAASASFTPTFQATIPDVLPDEQEYTKALSLSRLAYDLEPHAGSGFARRDVLSRLVRRYGAGVPGLCATGCLCDLARPGGGRAARLLRPHDTWPSHLPGDTPPSWAAGHQLRRRGRRRHGFRQHRGAGSGPMGIAAERAGIGLGKGPWSPRWACPDCWNAGRTGPSC